MVYTGIIYKYTSPSGKSYVGQTTRPNLRINEHMNLAAHGSLLPFHKAIRKYGIGLFDYTILCTVSASSKKEIKHLLDEAEIYYIKEFNSKVPFGYNVADGGEGNLGIKHSEKTRVKMSKSHIGLKHSTSTRSKMSSWQTGRKLPSSTKEKISKALMGKANNKKGCIQYTTNMELIAEYPSIKEAAKVLGICSVSISSALAGKYKTAGGFIWKYKD